jgi:hypothetical protein
MLKIEASQVVLERFMRPIALFQIDIWVGNECLITYAGLN